MSPALRFFMAIGITAAACLGPAVQQAAAQQPLRVEGTYPRQVPHGQRTVVNVVVPTNDEPQAEIASAQGVTVSGVRLGGVPQDPIPASKQNHRDFDSLIAFPCEPTQRRPFSDGNVARPLAVRQTC